MINPNRLIFIHGLEGTSQGSKATFLRSLFPGLLTPDFQGSLLERMQTLDKILGRKSEWKIIGSSFGGLMAALFACQHPKQVSRLVLLAPALILPEFAASPPAPVTIPTVIYHGSLDSLIPVESVQQIASQVFTDLTFHVVDDDHGLYKTIHQIDWPALLD